MGLPAGVGPARRARSRPAGGRTGQQGVSSSTSGSCSGVGLAAGCPLPVGEEVVTRGGALPTGGWVPVGGWYQQPPPHNVTFKLSKKCVEDINIL